MASFQDVKDESGNEASSRNWIVLDSGKRTEPERGEAAIGNCGYPYVERIGEPACGECGEPAHGEKVVVEENGVWHMFARAIAVDVVLDSL